MKVSFITVNYNNHDITVNYVASIKFLKKYKDYIDKIVIVDNCSMKNDYIALKESLATESDVVILRSEENVGYSRGINIGLDYLSDETYTYIIAGNNDLTFPRDFLINLNNASYNEDVFLVVPDIITLDKKHQNPQRISPKRNWKDILQDFAHSNLFTSEIFYFFRSLFKKNIHQSKQKNNVYSGNIYICTGAIFIFTRSYIKKCVKMEPIVFMWCEESILAAQILSSGGKTYLDTNLKVRHFENASVNSFKGKDRKKLYNESYKIAKQYIKRKINIIE